jgi:hypothetical protein
LKTATAASIRPPSAVSSRPTLISPSVPPSVFISFPGALFVIFDAPAACFHALSKDSASVPSAFAPGKTMTRNGIPSGCRTRDSSLAWTFQPSGGRTRTFP